MRCTLARVVRGGVPCVADDGGEGAEVAGGGLPGQVHGRRGSEDGKKRSWRWAFYVSGGGGVRPQWVPTYVQVLNVTHPQDEVMLNSIVVARQCVNEVHAQDNHSRRHPSSLPVLP